MPVIINSQETHPFLPSVDDPSAIGRRRAAAQDIRPLEVLIINLMADKISTERQLSQWLGHTPLQVRLTFAATDDYMQKVRDGHESKNTSSDHMCKFYQAWSEIKDRKFDGLIVTGVNALQDRVEQEAIWPEVDKILSWSETNVFSSLFLCWGAKAALKHFHNIDSIKGNKKTFGLFKHRLMSDKTGIAFGLPDQFYAPVSRWKNPDVEAIKETKAIEVVADSEGAGPNVLVESESYDDGSAFFARRLYVLNHPEYDTGTLAAEYIRDSAKNPDTPLPENYYPDDNAELEPLNQWRYTGFIYSNWIKTIYTATPYDINQVPQSC